MPFPAPTVFKTVAINRTLPTHHMAGDKRVELLPTESKSAALPLRQSPIYYIMYIFGVGLSRPSSVCSALPNEMEVKGEKQMSRSGAADGSRTRMVSPPRDFKSLVSTNSTTAACLCLYLSTTHF